MTADQEMRPTDADPRAYSIIVRYEKIESEWYYAAHCTELPDAHVYERSSCEAYASMLMIIEDLQEHRRDCQLPFPAPVMTPEKRLEWDDIAAALRELYSKPQPNHVGCAQIALAAADEIERLNSIQRDFHSLDDVAEITRLTQERDDAKSDYARIHKTYMDYRYGGDPPGTPPGRFADDVEAGK